jgi:hypothetical protein
LRSVVGCHKNAISLTGVSYPLLSLSSGQIVIDPEMSVASENVRFWEQVKCPVSSKSKIIQQSSQWRWERLFHGLDLFFRQRRQQLSFRAVVLS